MSEGWEEPTESAGEDRGGNEGSWNDDKNVEGEKAGDGWGENVEKESGVGRGEEGDEEVVPVADREGEEAAGHAEDDLGNGEGWGENGQKESAGTMENGKDSGDSNERNEGESRRERAPPEVNQMFTLKVDNLPYSVTAKELKEEFERFVRDSGGSVWGKDKGDGGSVVCGMEEEHSEGENCVCSLWKEKSRVSSPTLSNSKPFPCLLIL